MKKIKGWHDVTIQQYVDYKKLLQNTKEFDYNYLTSLVAIFQNISEIEAERFTINQVREFAKSLKFLEKMPTKPVNTFKIKGKEYFVECRIDKFSAGQFIDLNTYISEGVDENLHKIMTVFCLPVNRSFLGLRKSVSAYGKGYDLNKLAETFKDLGMHVAFPLSLFFCELMKQSEPHIRNSLNKEMKRTLEKLKSEVKKQKKHLKNIGAGTTY